jgi:predicted HicB family RNase H-like nuclease
MKGGSIMSEDVHVIWKRGDDKMPHKAAVVIEEARNELLFKALRLPKDVENAVRYNSEKNSQSVNEYLSSVIVQQVHP